MEPNKYAHMSQPDVCYRRNGSSFDTTKPVNCYCSNDISQLNANIKDIKIKLKSLSKHRKGKSEEKHNIKSDEIRRNIDKLQESLKNNKLCLRSAKKNRPKERYSIKKKASLSKTAIILLSVGGCVFVGGIIALIIVLTKRKKKKSVIPSDGKLESVITKQNVPVKTKPLEPSNTLQPTASVDILKPDVLPVKAVGSNDILKPDVLPVKPVKTVGSNDVLKPDY